MSTSIKMHRASTGLWTIIMWLLHKFAPDAPVTHYFYEEVVSIQDRLTCVEEASAVALACLSTVDQFLLLMARAPVTQARAAKRRYWKFMPPEPFAALYTAQKLDLFQADLVMRQEERMPGYLRKKVLALMDQ